MSFWGFSAVNSGSKDVFSKHGFSNWKLHKLGSNWKLKKHAEYIWVQITSQRSISTFQLFSLFFSSLILGRLFRWLFWQFSWQFLNEFFLWIIWGFLQQFSWCCLFDESFDNSFGNTVESRFKKESLFKKDCCCDQFLIARLARSDPRNHFSVVKKKVFVSYHIESEQV